MNPLLAQLSAEAWAMEPKRLEAFLRGVAMLGTDDLEAAGIKALTEADDGDGASYDVKDGVAHIPVRGVILKTVPRVFRWYGIEAASTVEISAKLNEAMADESVKAIMLDIEIPGGTVSGVQQLADEIHAARHSGDKPIRAHGEDLVASAAYWIASQADEISAGRSTAVGSIGVYTVIDDASAFFESSGIKRNLIATAPLKGYAFGARVSDEKIADVKREVMSYGALFADAIARGRGMSAGDVQKVATGQVWLGDEAKAKGLIDRVSTAADAHAALAASVSETEQDQPAPSVAPQTNAAESAGMVHADDEATEGQMTNESGTATVKAEGATGADKAKVDEMRAKLAEANKRARDVLIRQYADRVTASNRASVEEFGEFCGDDLEKFEAHLKSLPSLTRSEQVGADQEMADSKADPIDDGEADLCRSLGISAKQLRAVDDVVGVSINGQLIMRDGRKVDASEVI